MQDNPKMLLVLLSLSQCTKRENLLPNFMSDHEVAWQSHDRTLSKKKANGFTRMGICYRPSNQRRMNPVGVKVVKSLNSATVNEAKNFSSFSAIYQDDRFLTPHTFNDNQTIVFSQLCFCDLKKILAMFGRRSWPA